MTEESEKMTFKGGWELQKRGMKLWYQREPKLFVYFFLDAIFTVAMPYVLIYFSAKLLNELGGARRGEVLIQLILLTITIEAILGILRAMVQNKKAKLQGMMYLFNTEFYILLFVKLSETSVLHLHNSKRLPMVFGSSVIF